MGYDVISQILCTTDVLHTKTVCMQPAAEFSVRSVVATSEPGNEINKNRQGNKARRSVGAISRRVNYSSIGGGFWHHAGIKHYRTQTFTCVVHVQTEGFTVICIQWAATKTVRHVLSPIHTTADAATQLSS